MSAAAFVAPVSVVGRAGSVPTCVSKRNLSSDFVGTSLRTSQKQETTFAADRSFDVQCAIPLLDYKPSSQNARVAPIGQSIVDERPPAYTSTFRDAEDIEEAIFAGYNQIFGLHYYLEDYKQPFLESQYRSGNITAKDFIVGLVTSGAFLTENFYPNNNYRFVQKVVQRVLGRDTYSEFEKIAWSIVIATKGVKAFVEELVNGDEYQSVFGDKTIPYQRDRVLAGRSFGETPFKLANPRVSQRAVLRLGLRESLPQFTILDQRNKADFDVTTDVFPVKTATYGKSYEITPVNTIPFLTPPFTTNNKRVKNIGVAATEESPQTYSTKYTPTLQEADEIVYAAYRQIFSEHQIIKANRQVTLECEFRIGKISTKEFIRGLLTSETFLKYNYEANNNYRFARLVIERVLGRTTYGPAEEVSWSIVICNKGPVGFINAILDSDEYTKSFGENTVPYQIARVLPNRSVGETPYRLKTPRYDIYYRNTYTDFYDWEFVTRRYEPQDKQLKAGDPRAFFASARALGIRYPTTIPKINLASLKF